MQKSNPLIVHGVISDGVFFVFNSPVLQATISIHSLLEHWYCVKYQFTMSYQFKLAINVKYFC
jgi:hypothetical protein